MPYRLPGRSLLKLTLASPVAFSLRRTLDQARRAWTIAASSCDVAYADLLSTI